MAKQLYQNGTILTMEEENLYVEALLVEDGRILKTGKKKELEADLNEGDEVIDLNKKTMMPAFLDPHSHFSAYANSMLQVPLAECVNFHEIQEKISDFIEKNHVEAGTWVIAGGYDQNQLEEKRHPDRQVLDEAAPNHPVVIQHKSGHVGVFNSMALKKMGVTEETPCKAGGKMEKKDGKLTGYMEENAYLFFVQNKVPIPTAEEMMESFKKAQDSYLSYGITTLQEGMLPQQLVPFYEYMIQKKLLSVDVITYADIKTADSWLPDFEQKLKNQERVTVGGYKIFLDGSPQGRTAWMSKPYEKAEDGYCGYGTMKDEEVKAAIKKAVKEGCQLLAHCNGDAAAEQYLNMLQEVVDEGFDIASIRPVLIHGQLLRPDQIERVKALSVIPSFFIAHIYYWGDTHIENFGRERASHISPAGTALRHGVRFTLHQDTPVVLPDMFETIWCAVKRQTKDGEILGEDERITVYEALKAVTVHAAYQYFLEEKKGSIRSGKDADLIVLDRNPLEQKAEDLKSIQIEMVRKKGVLVYQKKS